MINQQTHALNDLVNKSICALTLGCLVMSMPTGTRGV